MKSGNRSRISLLVALVIAAIPVLAENLWFTSVEINEITPTLKLNKTDNKHRFYELRGYLNTLPVYLVVEKTGNRQIAGYLFDGKGKQTYIYGEWFKGELQVYDPTNTRLTIILSQ